MIAAGAASAWAFAFALVLCRVGAAIMLLPGFGEAEIPAVARAGLAVCLTLLVLPGLGPVAALEGWTAAAAVGAEVLTGLLLGWLVRCVAMALPVAAQVISFMAGLSSLLSPDPVLGQSTVLARAFMLAAAVLMFSTGLWALPVGALLRSYDVVPVGRLLPAGDTTLAAGGGVAAMFELAIRLAAPFIAAAVLWQVAVGVLSRVVPQMHVHTVAMPGQIAGGLLLLMVLSAALIGIWTNAAQIQFVALPGMH